MEADASAVVLAVIVMLAMGRMIHDMLERRSVVTRRRSLDEQASEHSARRRRKTIRALSAEERRAQTTALLKEVRLQLVFLVTELAEIRATSGHNLPSKRAHAAAEAFGRFQGLLIALGTTESELRDIVELVSSPVQVTSGRWAMDQHDWVQHCLSGIPPKELAECEDHLRALSAMYLKLAATPSATRALRRS